MELARLEAIVESVLFTYGSSVERSKLAEVSGAGEEELGEALKALEEKYAKPDSALVLLYMEDSIQLATKPELYEYLARAVHTPRKFNLSDSVLETLSIVAYKQPVTKLQIEHIRGVNSDKAVNKLLEYDLVQEVGRMNTPGRPILFGTTQTFLRCFGVRSIDELPEPDERSIEEFREQAEAEVEKDGEVNLEV